jgi:hypothetical protein
MIRQMLVTSLLVAFALPAVAQNTCDAGKLKCLRGKLSCLIKVYESSQKKGLPPDAAKLQKCMDKFDGGATPERGCFAKLEAKQDPAKPATVCSKTGDTAAAEADVDAYVAALLSLINATTPSTTTTTLPVTLGCCQSSLSSSSYCFLIDSASTCTGSGGTWSTGQLCGGDGLCATGTPAPGSCCDTHYNTSRPCGGGTPVIIGCTQQSGQQVDNAICEATGCRACKAKGATCTSGSECCSKTCLAVTNPKSCL